MTAPTSDVREEVPRFKADPDESLGASNGVRPVAPPGRLRVLRDAIGRNRFAVDLLVYGAYVALAVLACWGLWLDPYYRVSAHLPTDNIQFYQWLTHGAHTVSHLSNPFFSHQLNAPDGVNMMANTSVMGVSIPLAPITLWLGPQASYVVYLTLALAGSAATCYYVLSRYVVASRLAAFLGGAFFGFAPGVIHHANGQPNFVTNFLLPLIVLRVFRLHEPGRVIRNGVVLGLLVTWQLFINEELLLLTAAGCVAAVAIYAVLRRSHARQVANTFVSAGFLAVGIAVPLVAYPIWFQFFGPQSYHGIPHAFAEWGEDITAYFTFSRDTLAGDPMVEKSIGGTEQNSWFGIPLCLLLLFAIILTWRKSLAVRIVTILGAVTIVLATGPMVRFNGDKTFIPGPWRLVDGLPLVSFMYPSRLTYIVIACVAVVLAVSCDLLPKLTAAGSAAGSTLGFGRIWYVAVAVALVPIIPVPMPAMPSPNIPAFISDGLWKPYVEPTRTIVTAPLPGSTTGLEALLWQSVAGQEFRTACGYFLVPDNKGVGRFGAPQRATQMTLHVVASTGKVPEMTDEIRRAAVVDLAYWRAAIIVLDATHKRADAIRATVNGMIDIEPALLGGAWVWDVRALAGGKP